MSENKKLYFDMSHYINTHLVCFCVEIPDRVPGDHHHLPGHKVPAGLVIPGDQVGRPAEVLGLGGGAPVDLAPATPGVDVSVEGGDDRVVHGELDAVEGGDLGEKAHQAVLIDLDMMDY